MTVLTLPDQSAADTSLRPLPWRRMAWVTWRQHRPTLISVPAVLAAVAIFLLIAGLKIHHDFAALVACHPFSSTACQALNTSFNKTDWSIGNTVDIVLSLAAGLLGVFAGAPVLARELENGTYRYAWTQAYGRQRWAIAKIAGVAVVVTAAAGAFTAVFTWFFQPFLGQEDLNVLNSSVFANEGLAFAAWTLAAFTIGVFFGMLFRRVVPAMAVSLGVYFGLDLLAWLVLRKNYPVSLVTSNPNATALIGTSTNAANINLSNANAPWVLSTWYTGPGGKPASQAAVSQALGQFQNGHRPSTTVAQALSRHGLTEWARYIPVSRFWPMQFIEAGWLLVLSALFVAGTVWLVRHRAA